MPGERKSSWSASSQRRSSLTKAQGGSLRKDNAGRVGGVENIADVSKFTKQFNNRTKIPSSLPTRDVDLGVGNDDFGLDDDNDDDDDDEDFKLDNILSCIVNEKETKHVEPLPLPKLNGSVGLADLVGEDSANSMKSKYLSKVRAPSYAGKTNTLVKGDKHSDLNRRHITSLELEGDKPLRIDTPPIQNANPAVDEVNSPVSDEENDKLFSIRDVSDYNKMFVRQDQRPDYLCTGVESKISGGDILARSLLVDSILDDIQLSTNSRSTDICSSDQGPDKLISLVDAVTPPRGRITTKNSTHDATLPHRASRGAKVEEEVLGTNNRNNLDDETSAITEPTESPFIYTYKRSIDDDSVSQITSSIAGSSHLLRNVPSAFGSSSRSPSKQINRSSLTWMNHDSAVIGGGSRIIQRKGLYGRDRVRKSNKVSAFAVSGIGAWNHEGGGKNNLDEIAYVLNTDCTTWRNQSGKVMTQPLGKGRGQFFSQHGANDKSIGLSQHGFADDIKSSVSRLGMGGVSCGAQSVSEGTADTETTASTLGFFQHLALLAWNAQHRVGLYFFPVSPAVTQRKKFDRSNSLDSLEEMLLEEGVKTMPRRKQERFRCRNGDEDDDDEIDYFSRAMSTSSNTGFEGSRRSNRKSLFGMRRAAAIGGISVVLTGGYTIYRSPGKKKFSMHVERPPGITDANRVGRMNANGLVGSEGADSMNYQYYDIRLPQKFESLADVDDVQFPDDTNVPFYWHIPRSSGSTVKDVLGGCLHLTLAADMGDGKGHTHGKSLKVLHVSHEVSYLNVDTSTHQGIARAHNLNLISSGLADVVMSPLLHESLALFSPTHRGRMFAIFRHPVERATSLFYFLQDTQWKHPGTRNDQLADITIEEYFKQGYGYAENNWMTRSLSNGVTDSELTEIDLEVAKAVLKKKCLVGLMENKRESFERMLRYFNWNPKNEKDLSCLERKTEFAWSMMHDHPLVEENSQAWGLIVDANKFDMRLYAFVKELFSEQGTQLPQASGR